jgi:hypothetical protein
VCCFCYKKEKNQVSVGHLRHALRKPPKSTQRR